MNPVVTDLSVQTQKRPEWFMQQPAEPFRYLSEGLRLALQSGDKRLFEMMTGITNFKDGGD
jgi:hypothetical protein